MNTSSLGTMPRGKILRSKIHGLKKKTHERKKSQVLPVIRNMPIHRANTGMPDATRNPVVHKQKPKPMKRLYDYCATAMLRRLGMAFYYILCLKDAVYKERLPGQRQSAKRSRTWKQSPSEFLRSLRLFLMSLFVRKKDMMHHHL